jgi:predicted metal-binding protein
MATTLYVCETCRYDKETRMHDGREGGAILLAHIQKQAAQQASNLTIKSTRCLMACTQHCTVHLRAPGKINYVIGNFEPTAESATTLLDYAAKYQLSETGQVPYNTWPQGIKGHFIARTPPFENM